MTGDTYEKRQQHQRRGTDELSRAVDAVMEAILRIENAAETEAWNNGRETDPVAKANGEGYVRGLRFCLMLLEEADPMFGEEMCLPGWDGCDGS